MSDLHSLLKRQLRRFGLDAKAFSEEQARLLQVINEAYFGFDADRKMLEHSLELTSQELLGRNAELSQINAELEARVAARMAELSSSEARFRGLFEHAPVSIWEEDFSAVRQYLDGLRRAEVVDFSAHFDAHPEEVAECARRIKIVDVNRATLAMFQAESKDQLLADLSKVLGPDSLIPLKEELVALAHGETSFENESINYTLRGERRVVSIRLTIAPGYEQTWSKVFVGVGDITERGQAEKALRETEAKYRTLVEHMPAIVYVDVADESRNTVYINSQVEKLLGYSPEDWIAKPDLCIDIVHPEDSARMWRELDESETRGQFACDYRYIAKDGHIVWVRDEASLIKNEGERPSVWQGVMLDITAQKEAEEALRQSEERFKLMAWATKDAVWDWDLRLNQIWWGEGLQKITHFSADMGQTDPEWRVERIHPEDRAKVNRAIAQALEGGMDFWSKEYRLQRKDGTYAAIMDRGYILRDDAGQAHRMIGAMMDITERKQDEETIRSQNEMLSSLHQITLDLLRFRENDQLLDALVELSARFLDASYVEIMLVEGEELVVKATSLNQSRLIGQRMARGDALLSWAAFDTREPAVLSDYATWPHRRAIYAEFMPHAVADFPILNDDQCLGVLALGRDKPDYEFTIDQIQYGRLFANLTALVLNNAQLREALREQSIRDPLTGLYNRRYLEEMLSQQLSRVTRRLHPLGMIMIDIDHFKRFNDTYGHATGDGVLRGLARFLQRHIRGGDIACRYGGEEFLLIMPDTSLEVAQQRAEAVWRGVRRLRWPNSHQSQEGITLSVGVAGYPVHGRTMESLLHAADTALYQAKREGRDRVVVAEDGMAFAEAERRRIAEAQGVAAGRNSAGDIP
jgi:diguanylate cyclase (GGDEF)-like protein/PAS domain S-box-containing protein